MKTIIFALLFAFPTTAFAQVAGMGQSGRVGPYVGLQVGLQQPNGSFYDYDGDGEVDAEQGPAANLTLGWRVSPNLALEGSYTVMESEVAGTDDKQQITSAAAGIRLYPGEGALEPSIVILASPDLDDPQLATFKLGDGKAFGYTTEVGMGLRFLPIKSLWLGAEVRYAFVRYVDGEFTFGPFTVSGNLGTQRHGDYGTVLVGGGVQF